MSATETETLFDAEEERVSGERADALGRAGFAVAAAMDLALRPDIDLNCAVSLVGVGCPPKTTVRILH